MQYRIVQEVKDCLDRVGIRVKFNEFTNSIMVVKEGQERRLEDTERSEIIVALHDWKVQVKGQLLEATLDMLAHQNSYHPVRDYLDALVWDKVPRVERWLTTYLGAEDDTFVRKIGELVLIAAVRRIRRPGCKFDEILTLVSPEGSGKSETVAALVPNLDWFSDQLPLGADPKLCIERTGGIWVCESAELVGQSKSGISEVKAFLSRQVDGPVRMAYARETITRPRQFVPIATTNETAFLQSMTGDRRFWPIDVTKGEPEEIAKVRDQLWAEANELEKTGCSIRLPVELWEEARKAQDGFRNEDPWEDALSKLGMSVSLTDIFDRLAISLEQRTPEKSRRVAGVMRKLGYKKTREMVNGTRITMYRKLTPFDPETFDYHSKWVPEVEEEMSAEDEALMDKWMEGEL